MRIGILRYAYLLRKEQGQPAFTATQPVTGSLHGQWPRAFRDGEAERLAVLIDHGRLLHRQIGRFLRHCFHCLKGSDRQALDLVDRDARCSRFCGAVRGLGFC